MFVYIHCRRFGVLVYQFTVYVLYVHITYENIKINPFFDKNMNLGNFEYKTSFKDGVKACSQFLTCFLRAKSINAQKNIGI